MVPSAGKWVEGKRQELLASGILAEDGNRLVSKEGHTFMTPGGAAIALLGRNADGWKQWKSKSGATLDELKGQTDIGGCSEEGGE